MVPGLLKGGYQRQAVFHPCVGRVCGSGGYTRGGDWRDVYDNDVDADSDVNDDADSNADVGADLNAESDVKDVDADAESNVDVEGDDTDVDVL